MEKPDKHKINRRTFLKIFGVGAAATTTAAVTGCSSNTQQENSQKEPPVGKMTYRINPNTGDKVSILGYGMMRLPTVGAKISAREKGDGEIDQEMVNKQIDYA
ncbi:MAG TPA: aldo/keto reductase, partial [Prevotellaceae bacterium]|nr:aldo/keto reductase [Prevotellaceae bacterium]